MKGPTVAPTPTALVESTSTNKLLLAGAVVDHARRGTTISRPPRDGNDSNMRLMGSPLKLTKRGTSSNGSGGAGTGGMISKKSLGNGLASLRSLEQALDRSESSKTSQTSVSTNPFDFEVDDDDGEPVAVASPPKDVADEDGNKHGRGRRGAGTGKDDEEEERERTRGRDIFRRISPSDTPAASLTPVAAAPPPSRRSRQYFSKLPTLDETSSSESDSFENDDKDNADMLANAAIVSKQQQAAAGASPKKKLGFFAGGGGNGNSSNGKSSGDATTSRKGAVSPPPQSQSAAAGAAVAAPASGAGGSSSNAGGSADPAASSSAAPATTANSNAGKPAQPRRPKTFQDRVRDLSEQAEDLASRGKEDDALSVYKRALKMNRMETSRIKAQLKQVDGKHPSTVQSIASRLYEDWLQVGTNIAEIRCQMAVLSERVGDYDRALACCSEARGVYKRQLTFLERKKLDTSGVKGRAKTLNKLTDKLARAKVSFNSRKHMHEEIIVLRRAVQAEHGDPKQLSARLEETAQRALALETDSLGREHPQVADTLSVLASIAIEQGRSGRAERFLKEAIVIAQNALGSKHPQTGELILQMARVKASQPKMDEEAVLRYYEDALENFRLVNPSLVAAALNEMAVIRIRQRQYAVAIDLLNQAVDSSEPQDSLVQVYRNLGECYSHMRDYDKAADAFVRALDRQREGRKQLDAVPEEAGHCSIPLVDDNSIADTVRRLGKAYMGLGRHTDAVTMYGEALLIHRASVLKAVNPVGGKPNDGLPDRQDQLAHTLFCIAEAREIMGDLSEAERVYAESMQLRLFSDAHRAEKRQNMIHCAMCLRGIGLVHLSRKEYDAAQRVLEDALRYCEGHGLTDEHPISASIRQKLQEAVSKKEREAKILELQSQYDNRLHDLRHLEQAAQIQISNGDLDNAIDTLTKLMSTRKVVLKLMKAMDLDSTNEKVETAYTLKLFGKVLLKRGDKLNAERAFGDALKLFRKGDEKDQAAIDEVKHLVDRIQKEAVAL